MEIAFHDRGPVDAEQMGNGGSWSVYWYNGLIVSSEISRGLDVFELTPSEYVTQNEIDAANTVVLGYLNAQGQPKYVWPPSFALSRAYTDQMERDGALRDGVIEMIREELTEAESGPAAQQQAMLMSLADEIMEEMEETSDHDKLMMLAGSVRDLATAVR